MCIATPTRTRAYNDIIYCGDAYGKLLEGREFTAAELVLKLTDRVISKSTSFSGIGGREVSDAQTTNEVKVLLRGLGIQDIRAVQYNHTFAIEWSPQAYEELLALPDGVGPAHVFTDIRDFVPIHLRRAVGLDGGVEWSAARLRKVLPTADVKLLAHCVECGKTCHLQRADEHEGSSVCKDFSTQGAKRGMAGPYAKFFFIWIAMRRKLKEKRVTHENVNGFPLNEMEALLGDLYIIIELRVNPSMEGWPMERPRQVLYMILKTFIHPILMNSGVDDLTSCAIQRHMGLGRAYKILFHRDCDLSLYTRLFCFCIGRLQNIKPGTI